MKMITKSDLTLLTFLTNEFGFVEDIVFSFLLTDIILYVCMYNKQSLPR